jgi:alpha-glucoside transport system permease protein
VSSFRPAGQVATTGWWTIFSNWGLTLDSYTQVLAPGNSTLTLADSFINSIAITLPATIFPLVIASMAAYAFAWIDFRGKNAVFIGVFALQIVPLQMALVPLLSLFSRGLTIGGVAIFPGLNASGSYTQVWIAHTIFALPLAIFLLHNFISEIPRELIEAARVDGAGHGQIFFRIVLPLTMPAIASFAIFQFLWVWNDLLVALVFADGRVAPITKALAELTGRYGESWHLLTAGAFVSILVPLIVFFALQRFFVRGLLAGSTKG